jgi:hypothetical protein
LSEIQRADPIAGFAFDSPRAWYERTRRDHGSRVSIYLGLDQPGSERGTPVAGRRRAEPWSLGACLMCVPCKTWPTSQAEASHGLVPQGSSSCLISLFLVSQVNLGLCLI